MRALLIPVKSPAHGKSRLASLLSFDERARLAWMMFEDVSSAVSATTEPDRVFLVSSCERALEHARGLGWDLIVEKNQESESASVDWASRILAERGFDAVMRLPADLPLVQSRDIDRLISIDLKPPAAVVVPSREGTGTNAIIRTPADLFPSRFGPNSLALHKEEAARAGVLCQVIDNDRIALDIDEPSDLMRLLELDCETRTSRFAKSLRLQDRMNFDLKVRPAIVACED